MKQNKTVKLWMFAAILTIICGACLLFGRR